MFSACSRAADQDGSGDEVGDSRGSTTRDDESTGAGDDAAGSTTVDGTTSTTSADGSESDSTGAPADPFTITVFDHTWLSSFEASQSADADIDFGEGPFASARLVVELESPCFPFSKWREDPPPPGHNWPAACDAFDRIANIVADPDGDAPSFELLRTITPFGGPLTTEVDLTDWANGRPGAHVLRGFVSTWTDAAGQVSGAEGGWFLSARIEVEPGPAPRQVLAVLPLFHGDVNAENSAVSIPLELPEGTTSARIDYLVSGHGGGPVGADCIGPADEFCHREHTLHFDDTELGAFEPWRDDCVDLCTIVPDEWQWDYCAENPCGAIASVQAPRANWCPGSPVAVTPIDLAALATPGAHVFAFEVAGIGEGGVWPTSVIAYAYGD
ncbi:MAG TPA: peptide-N-glycosidase F-related protein [Nannocystaceae bacterium]|nr:peptide-N-glycosidase F-related protein [Nannocystaceae bacterium]